MSWGAPGVEPGEFQVPHNVVVDSDENVYVTDRENYRLQVFDRNGNLQAIWQNIYRPQALCMDQKGIIYVGEMLMDTELIDYPMVGHRLNAFTKAGRAPGPNRRRPDRRRADAVHRAARLRRGLEGQPVRRRGVAHRLRPADGPAADVPVLPEAQAGGVTEGKSICFLSGRGPSSYSPP